MKARNRVGERIGTLTVIERVGSSRGSSTWLCLCDCGNTVVKTNKFIKKSGNYSGCSQCYRGPKWQGVGSLGITHWNRILKQAKDRNLDVSLTQEQAWALFRKQKEACYFTGLPLTFKHGSGTETTASLDRLDSSSGYSEDNCVWVHKDINKMKQDFSPQRFIYLCSLVKKEPDVPEIV